MDTQNYKRTLKGSVGAGIGALTNGSSRTYYILEHKTPSKFHQAGEAQKIIVDQIELGRGASCQVRFDDDCETVSRKHAAIVREGDNWKLIHLSKSNPTYVNGQPINDSYYLQSGDEIQLSSGGPRMGFIVPQGRQALTSSIGMTERMNLFRKQALRPYKTAITIMSLIIVIAVVGLGFWNWSLSEKNEQLARQAAEQQMQLVEYQGRLDANEKERIALENQQKSLERQLAESGNDNASIKAQLAGVQGRLAAANSKSENLKDKIDQLREELTSPKYAGIVTNENNDLEVSPVNYKYENESDFQGTDEQNDVAGESLKSSGSTNISKDLKDYYDDIYTLKIQNITLEKDGQSHDAGISMSDIPCGTGFMLEDGTFVTDRQNIEPWVYTVNSNWVEPWRKALAQYKACGCNIVIHYKAYSQKGTGKPLTFSSNEFHIDHSSDRVLTIEIDKPFKKKWKDIFGEDFKSGNSKEISVFSNKSHSYAKIHRLGAEGEGIPYNVTSCENLPGGTEIHMVGYSGTTKPQLLRLDHFNNNLNTDDVESGTIRLQSQINEPGYYGSPAFIKTNDGYEVVGLYVGSTGGKDRLVPISKIL